MSEQRLTYINSVRDITDELADLREQEAAEQMPPWAYVNRNELIDLCRTGQTIAHHPDGRTVAIAVQVYGDESDPLYRPPRKGAPFVRLYPKLPAGGVS